MCYVLDFEFDDSYKACKFTAFPRTFQIINNLFFKEVYNGIVYRMLHKKKKPLFVVNIKNKNYRRLVHFDLRLIKFCIDESVQSNLICSIDIAKKIWQRCF